MCFDVKIKLLKGKLCLPSVILRSEKVMKLVISQRIMFDNKFYAAAIADYSRYVMISISQGESIPQVGSFLKLCFILQFATAKVYMI